MPPPGSWHRRRDARGIQGMRPTRCVYPASNCMAPGRGPGPPPGGHPVPAGASGVGPRPSAVCGPASLRSAFSPLRVPPCGGAPAPPRVRSGRGRPRPLRGPGPSFSPSASPPRARASAPAPRLPRSASCAPLRGSAGSRWPRSPCPGPCPAPAALRASGGRFSGPWLLGFAGSPPGPPGAARWRGFGPGLLPPGGGAASGRLLPASPPGGFLRARACPRLGGGFLRRGFFSPPRSPPGSARGSASGFAPRGGSRFSRPSPRAPPAPAGPPVPPPGRG